MELEKFKAVVLPLRERLLAMAHKMLSNESDADDAVQETLIKLWQSKSRISIHPNVGGYAMQTLKNTCLDKIKLKKSSVLIDDMQLGSDSNSPYQNIENKNSVEIIKRIIESLPELQRKTISMRDIEEYELSEIAEITGSNVAAVKVNLSRARKKVRDIFVSIQSLKIDDYE